MDSLTLYTTLLLAGFVLIGTEIFIPGGILGILGGVVWVSAAVVGWRGFPAPWNVASALALLFFGVLTFVVWMRYFPKSRLGRSLSLNKDAGAFKSHSTQKTISEGMSGVALSALRPSGIARIEGERLDVLADGEWIESGTPVEVLSVSAGRIVVGKKG